MRVPGLGRLGASQNGEALRLRLEVLGKPSGARSALLEGGATDEPSDEFTLSLPGL